MPRFRRCCVLPLAAALVLGWSAPARAASSSRLIIVWMDGRTLGDWSAQSLPNFHRLLGESAVGILSTRTAGDSNDPAVMRSNAMATFNTGAQTAAEGDRPILASGRGAGPLGEALARPGLGTSYRRLGPRDTDPSLLHLDRSTPLAAAFDLGRDGMAQVDHTVGVLMKDLSPRDLLVVVSGDPPVARQRRGIRLSAVAIKGTGFPAGLLTSPSTRRDGIITLTDLAPTILDALGLPTLPGVTGRVATVVPRAHPITYLQPLERDIVRASLDRYPLTRWMMIIAMVLVAAALALALRARATTNRILPTLLIAVAAAPLSLYINGAFHPSSLTAAALEAAGVALALGLSARATLGVSRALVVVLGLTALVPLVDLLFGTPLGIRSPIAFQIASGGRFYGIDGGTLGVIVGAEIFAAALLVERAVDKQRVAQLVALVFAASVWLMGAPSFGSKFGAALTAVPAFAVLATLIAGKRITKAYASGIAAVTLVVTGLLIAVDALRKTGSQSHVARAVEGKSGVGSIVARKVHLQYVTTFHTIWTPAILVFAGAIVVVLWRRRDLIARALEWHTLLKPALLAALVGGIAGFLFNDGGVLVTAPIAMFAAATLFSVLLSPGYPEPARGTLPS